MSETQNLSSVAAISKLRSLVTSARTCMFASELTSIPVHVCPMETQQVDEAGDLWFFSGAGSHHQAHIDADARVQLIFSNPSNYEYLTVYGEASITQDRAKVDELWNPEVKAWFPEGKDDPSLRLIRVRPVSAHYWATKDGKMISTVKMIAAGIAGKVPDIGISGDLEVTR